MKSIKFYLAGIVLCAVIYPAFGQTEEDTLINSYWLTDKILLVGYGEMKMDMVAAVNTEGGIVVIDAGMSASLTAKHKSIIERKMGRSDFKYLINTHAHVDHTNGNQIFKGSEIIAHKNTIRSLKRDNDKAEIEVYLQSTREKNKIRKQLKSKLDPNSQMHKELRDRIYLSERMCDDYESFFKLTLPNITITDQLTLDMGDMKIYLKYFGPGFHSDGDILVSIPDQKTVFTGDVILPMDQFQNVNSRSDFKPWLDCLDEILEKNTKLHNVVAYHVGILPAEALINFHQELLKMQHQKETKKNAVDSLKMLISELSPDEIFHQFEETYLKTSTDEFYVFEGDLLSLTQDLITVQKYKEAIIVLEIHEELFPRSTRGYFNLAKIYELNNDFDLAINAYKKMLKLDPNNWYYASLIHQLDEK